MGEDAFVEDERNRRAMRREVKKFVTAVHQAVPIADSETRLSRRTVQPARESAARIEVSAQLPAAIVEAEAAARAEKEFRFDDASGDVACATQPVGADEESAFHFFSDQGD